MARIAIIGTGISGLSAAFLLGRMHDITVYEKDARPGGHSRTLHVPYGDRTIAVDTGFIVFNKLNYPNLTSLFEYLDVPVRNSDMSFALTVGNGWLEWGAKDLTAIVAQRRNLLRPQFLRLFVDVMRFNKGALAIARREPELSVGALIKRMRLGNWFRRHYLLPMAGAIWSCPPKQMLEFPALSLLEFFANHHLLSMTGQPQWLTVEGGSDVYVRRIADLLGDRLRTGCAATRVLRTSRGVMITDQQGTTARYDEVVFATHSDQTSALLGDASSAERNALSAIRYQPNRVVLHRDPGFMPQRRSCWGSWVYHADNAGDEAALSVTYWMNNLQGIDERYPLFVTLNPSRLIASADIFDTHEFSHPVFDFAALQGQRTLLSLQGRNRTWFCGAWLGYGFHEDGLVSAMNVAERLGAPAPWSQQRQRIRFAVCGAGLSAQHPAAANTATTEAA
ncbi:MAG TPA: FAD-dependent oxidoreductase [Rhizomicrobium sp.]|jgi:hypothetical protein